MRGKLFLEGLGFNTTPVPALYTLCPISIPCIGAHSLPLYCHVLVAGVIEHIELDKGPDMVDKAGAGGKKWISQKWLSNETDKQTNKQK